MMRGIVIVWTALTNSQPLAINNTGKINNAR
jgi:hypothetical protein